MKKKIREWSSRYLPAEFYATLGALAGAGIFYILTGNKFIAAYAGTMGENIGYYGYISLTDLKKKKAHYLLKKKHFGIIGYLHTVTDLIHEFGISELLDSSLIRPFCLYFFTSLPLNYALGIFIGKLAADVVFYIPTIIAYELKKIYHQK